MAGPGRLVPFDRHWFGRQHSWGSDPWTTDIFRDSPAVQSPSSRVFDQHFGVGLWDDDLFPPTPFRGWYLRPRRRDVEGGAEAALRSGVSEVASTEKDFRINLDVSHFKPEELSVKTIENTVVVHAKHQERPDEHGFVQREFKRVYVLPKEVNPDNVKSTLSADGVLTVTAPKAIPLTEKERIVPIEQVPSPSSEMK